MKILYLFLSSAECSKGSFYNMSTSECELCPLNFYQDLQGKHYCKPCPALHGTESEGMKSLEQCVGKYGLDFVILQKLHVTVKCLKGTI